MSLPAVSISTAAIIILTRCLCPSIETIRIDHVIVIKFKRMRITLSQDLSQDDDIANQN